MVSGRTWWRALALLAWLGQAAGCSNSEPPARQALLLHGFKLVDPESRSVTERDLVIEQGRIVAAPTLPNVHRIDGQGQFLLPALWDLKASLWGNNSLVGYDVLKQDMSFTRCLGVHLYYGVAHVGVFGMRREWVARELRRSEALELSASESLYPETALCGAATFACEELRTPATLRLLLDARRRAGAPFVAISYLGPKDMPLPGLSRELLDDALTAARERGLPTLVLIGTWQQAQEAAELGASVVHGLPGGAPPATLAQTLRDKQVAFAPALAGYLEMERLLGSEAARNEPALTATVSRPVLDTFRSERDIDKDTRVDLQLARAHQQTLLQAVRDLSAAGVRIVAASDAGWFAGAFQGYGSHAAQAWLERAGVQPWARLAAATTWPAQALGRRVGFEPGDAADFVALELDPLQSAENLLRIALVLRQGKVVDRARLLPDLTRSDYPAQPTP